MSFNSDEPESNQELNPSTYVHDIWIYARNPCPQQYTQHSGKWLIFRETGRAIDNAWAVVRRATESGQLGPAAKVSTKVSTMSRHGQIHLRGLSHMIKQHVICVYTYDSTDEDDAMRVRIRLNRLGFNEELAYKTDQATRDREYTYMSGKRVSLWRV